MKQIYTSYFANVRNLSPEMNPIGISRGKNKYLPGLRYDQRLAPTWAMMKMSQEAYDIRMKLILEKLDAQEIYDSLPENAVLLCYEKFNDRCHRRMVAEWLENELGIVVPEYGLKREESFPYVETGKHNKGKKRVPAPEPTEPEKTDSIPESVRLRQESYKRDKENMSLFDFLD